MIKPSSGFHLFGNKPKKPHHKKISGFTFFAFPYLAVVLFLILIPVLMIFMYAFLHQEEYTNTIYFDFSNFIRFIQNDSALKSLWKSLELSIITTVICLLLGYPMAYIISKAKPRVQQLLILGITAPMWINMLLRVLAWRQIFLMADEYLGINLLASSVGSTLGMVYVYLPFMIIPIYTMLLKIDKSLLEASSDLGANDKQTFWRVVFPLSTPGIMSGITMVLLPTATTLVVPEILSNNTSILIGNFIETYFKNIGDKGMGSAISIVLAMIIMAMVMITRRLDKFSALEEKGD